MQVLVNGKHIEVDYQVLEADIALGRLRVRYSSPYLPSGVDAIVDLPVENGAVVPLQGDMLRDYIIGCGPMLAFARAEAAGKTDLDYLAKLVERDPGPKTPDPVIPATRERFVFEFGRKNQQAVDGAITRDTMVRDPRYYVGNGLGVTHARGAVGAERAWRVGSFMARSDVPWVALCTAGRVDLVEHPPAVAPWSFVAGDCNGEFPDFMPGDYLYRVVDDFEEFCVTTFDEGLGRYTNMAFDWRVVRPALDQAETVLARSVIIVGIGTISASGVELSPGVYPLGAQDEGIIFRAGSVSLVARA